jgi:N-acetyl sugar amidotransferase
MSSGYKICTKSVMDNTADPNISFDEAGTCNYYHEYVSQSQNRLFQDEPQKLEKIVASIKKSGQGKEYDCLIGVSGGVDSTFVAYKVKQLGLRPLAVHFDNGWNSELAVKNIEKVLTQLGIDLFTHVIDWEEFKSVQIAFLKASTPDGEIPTDHAIFALLYKVANEKGIKYIINGNNFATESVMPLTWSYGHIDWQYIKTINNKFGTRPRLKSYPTITPLKYFYFTFLRGIKIVSILNYMEYNKEETMKLLQEKLGWVYYGGKHYESIYTRFFQGYILPVKFGIDKRRAHLSSLIFAGQISREQALSELDSPIYPEGLLEEDKSYVSKKFELSKFEFESIMKAKPKTFQDYPNQFWFLQKLRSILNFMRGKGILHS